MGYLNPLLMFCMVLFIVLLIITSLPFLCYGVYKLSNALRENKRRIIAKKAKEIYDAIQMEEDFNDVLNRMGTPDFQQYHEDGVMIYGWTVYRSETLIVPEYKAICIAVKNSKVVYKSLK